MKHVLLVTVWIMQTWFQVSALPNACRSKFDVYDEDVFNLHTCSWCYFFLFPGHPFKPHREKNLLILVGNNTLSTSVEPDIYNVTAKKMICASLTSEECDMWQMCCISSRACCKHQLQLNQSIINNMCQPTWDGFGCWDAGTPGKVSQISCPEFLPYSVPTKSALKTCLSDGTWLKKDRLEWTDYTPCLNYQEMKITIFIGLACQASSLMCLLPSVFIFFKFKSLIHQHRIRLHVNFFLSFICSGICTILWNTTVTYDKLTNANILDTHMHKNSVQCKLLSFLKIYFTSTNYIWMFCEGLYLYRLIANAFSPPKRLLGFYIFGWATPLIYTTVYAIVRLTQANKSCWAKSLGAKEWIFYTPNLLCLVVNIYFLCSILRILMTQLQVHPNEPSSFRRALKATFVLIPLFGVQLVVTIYRVPPEMPGSVYYERFSEFISNSQGLFVAIMFCLCNGEVSSLVRHTLRHPRDTITTGSKRRHSATSLNMTHTITSRCNNHVDKTSPSRNLILCVKNREESTGV